MLGKKSRGRTLGRKGRGITAQHHACGHRSLHPNMWGCTGGTPLLPWMEHPAPAHLPARAGRCRHRWAAQTRVSCVALALLGPSSAAAERSPGVAHGQADGGSPSPSPWGSHGGGGGPKGINGGYQLLQPLHIGVEVLGGLGWRELPEGVVHVGVGGRDTAQQQPAASRRGGSRYCPWPRSGVGGLGAAVPQPASPYPAAGQLLASPSLGVSVRGLSPAGSPPPLARRVFSQASLSSSERVWRGAEGLGSVGPPRDEGCGGLGGAAAVAHLQQGELPAPLGDADAEALGGAGSRPRGDLASLQPQGADGVLGATGLGEHAQGSLPHRAPQPLPPPAQPHRQETCGCHPPSAAARGAGTPPRPLPMPRTSFSILSRPGAVGWALPGAILLLLLLLAEQGPDGLRMEIQRAPYPAGFKPPGPHPTAMQLSPASPNGDVGNWGVLSTPPAAPFPCPWVSRGG